MTATIHRHPTAIAADLKLKRQHWLHEAARFHAKGDTANSNFCQGRAGAFDEVIVLLGGEGINLSMSQFEELSA